MTRTIRLLQPSDAEAYLVLRAEMFADAPFAFLSSAEDDRALDVEVMRSRLGEAPSSVIVGAFESAEAGERLCASVGLMRDRYRKCRHKAWIWGVFVSPSARGAGVARRLLQTALEHARSLEGVVQVNLSVSASTPNAYSLYRSFGFEVWGTEPSAVCIDGVEADELHMSLRLD